MKNWLVALVLMFSFSTTFAVQLNVDGELTAEQKAQLQLQAAQMAKQNGIGPLPSTPEKVEQWVNVGTAIGRGLAGTAQELGVAADKIADTRVGLFAMILIAWHYVGADLVSTVFGFLWLATLIPTWVWMYRRQFLIESIQVFDKGKREDGLRKKVVFRDSNHNMEGTQFAYWATLFGLCLVGVLAILV